MTAEGKSNNGDESSRELIKAETARVDEAGGGEGWWGGVVCDVERVKGGKRKKRHAFICIMLDGFPF